MLIKPQLLIRQALNLGGAEMRILLALVSMAAGTRCVTDKPVIGVVGAVLVELGRRKKTPLVKMENCVSVERLSSSAAGCWRPSSAQSLL